MAGDFSVIISVEHYSLLHMPNIIWLASYPKSGNTWLRFLLYSYLFGEVRRSDDLSKRLPDIHVGLRLSEGLDETIYCKTHYRFSECHPCLKETSGFIYILRHPKDVLLSNLNYFRVMGRAGTFDEIEFARRFIEDLGVKKWINMGMGSWVEHAESWLSGNSYPHVVLRYESMLQDPRAAFEKVLEFLGIEIDPLRLNRAIHLASFEKLRALEISEKKKNRYNAVFSGDAESFHAGFRFMNKGKSGQTLRHLGADIERQFDERFIEALEKFGYRQDT